MFLHFHAMFLHLQAAQKLLLLKKKQAGKKKVFSYYKSDLRRRWRESLYCKNNEHFGGSAALKPIRFCKPYRFPYQIKCVNNPSRSFGSNQVLLGGITFPLSAILNSCSIVTGYKLNAICISPLSTLFSNSFKPLMPPMKSIRLSVR